MRSRSRAVPIPAVASALRHCSASGHSCRQQRNGRRSRRFGGTSPDPHDQSRWPLRSRMSRVLRQYGRRGIRRFIRSTAHMRFTAVGLESPSGDGSHVELFPTRSSGVDVSEMDKITPRRRHTYQPGAPRRSNCGCLRRHPSRRGRGPFRLAWGSAR